MITALMPALFTSIAPPGSSDIPLVIGTLTFGVTVIVAIAAFSSHETFRARLEDLGNKKAEPISKEEYELKREQAFKANV